MEGSVKSKSRARRGHGSLGAIDPRMLYRTDELMRRMGWSESAYYAARRKGLKIHQSGKRTYALGCDVIAYVTREVAP